MIVFLICKFSLPASSIGCLSLGFSVPGLEEVACCLLGFVLSSSGLLAAHGALRFAEMSLNVHPGSGSLGKLLVSRFVVTEGRQRHRQVPEWLQAAPVRS